jgi:protein-disulfide isomerase
MVSVTCFMHGGAVALRHRLLRCLLIGVGMAPLTFGGLALGAQFTPEQRAEIIQILRDALKTDPTILRDAVSAYQADQVQHQADAAKEMITTNHDTIFDKSDPAVGSDKPSVTIVEFFDPRCPYCRGLEDAMATWLRQDAGVRLIYKDLPILGPPSVLGSRALLAAQRQGGYDKLRDALMSGSPNITEDSIRTEAQKLGLDWAKLQKDMGDPAIQQRLDSNVQLAKQLGIEGTPGFVVGDRLVVGSDVAEVKDAAAAVRAKGG